MAWRALWRSAVRPLPIVARTWRGQWGGQGQKARSRPPCAQQFNSSYRSPAHRQCADPIRADYTQWLAYNPVLDVTDHDPRRNTERLGGRKEGGGAWWGEGLGGGGGLRLECDLSFFFFSFFSFENCACWSLTLLLLLLLIFIREVLSLLNSHDLQAVSAGYLLVHVSWKEAVTNSQSRA